MGKQLTDEQVVDIYMQAHKEGLSLRDAAVDHGVSPQYLDWRAKRLRNAGVNLPKKYAAIKVDVTALNERIKRNMGKI